MNYADRELAAKAEGLQKFALYFALPSLPAMIDRKMQQVKDSGMCQEIFTSDGNIELDAVKTRAEQAMQHCQRIEIGSFAFNTSDVQILYDYIR